jgi:hypothetical protein
MESQIIEVFTTIGSVKYSMGYSFVVKFKDGTIKGVSDIYRLESQAEEDRKYMMEKYPEEQNYGMHLTLKELPRYF